MQTELLFLVARFYWRTIVDMSEVVDAELKQIHFTIMGIYNRETSILKTVPTTIDSINTTNFLAGQAVKFADAAIILMEDGNQPLDVPAALLRTCLEAQARANHVIAATGNDRENRGHELIVLMHKAHDYYEKQCIQLSKETITNESSLLPRDRAYFSAMKKFLFSVDTSDLKTVKKEYEELNRKWGYSKVIEKQNFSDPVVMKRSEAQALQPMLHLAYLQSCAFVHSDPASLQHGQRMTKIGLTYTIVLAEVLAVLGFFTAVGKEKDQDLVDIKKKIIAFDINERVLPKNCLPQAEN